MLDTAMGFSLMVSIVITATVYFITREKNRTEQEQKDKLNDMIILLVITFIVVLFGNLCFSESPSTTLIKVTDMKGGQCPF